MLSLELIICIFCIGIFILIILTITGIYRQNEKLKDEVQDLQAEIKELKLMLKDRIIHIKHTIRE